MPTPNESQRAGLGCHPEATVNALTAESLPRAGAARDSLQAE